MITPKFIIPAVMVACVSSAFAAKTDPVVVAKDTIALVTEAQKVLAGVKDEATAKDAVMKLKELTQKAKILDKSMDDVEVTPDQATEISKLIEGAQKTVTKILEDCSRIEKAKLLTPELKAAINKFADKTDVQLIEDATEEVEIEEIED